MKKIILYLIIIFTPVAFFSCDKIDSPYLRNKGTTQTDTTSKSIHKKILLEDFTGHYCPNCPAAHEVAMELKDQYGDSLIIISIHAGNLATPSAGNYAYDFRTATSNQLNTDFGVPYNPIGMINRKINGGNILVDYGNWTSVVGAMINDTAIVSLKITNTYNSSTKQLDVKVESKFLATDGINYKLCVYLTEDSIVAYQKYANPATGHVEDVPDYVHRHVLRDAINSTYGDLISEEALEANKTYTANLAAYTLKPEWVAKHCSVVAFIYNVDTKEVIQAEEAPVIQSQK